MANLRTLKRNISLSADDLISTICIKSSLNDDKFEKASELIVEVAAFRTEFLSKVSAISVEKPASKKRTKENMAQYTKSVKAYYSKLKEDYTTKFNEFIDKITKL
jgi:hypothetical protein